METDPLPELQLGARAAGCEKIFAEKALVATLYRHVSKRGADDNAAHG
jgi:hypothetical protein